MRHASALPSPASRSTCLVYPPCLSPFPCRQWTLLSEPHDRWVGVPHALPSDSRFRADMQALQHGDLQTAQEQKELIERRQRLDKRAREGGEAAAGH